MHDMPFPKPEDPSFDAPLVMGIGISAGGLKAVGELLETLGEHSSKLAIVFVPSFAPSTSRPLAETVAEQSALPVIELNGSTKLRAGTVYVCRPTVTLTIKQGVVKVHTAAPGQSPKQPIDQFFGRLAADQGTRSIGILLGSADDDGILGLRAINEQGGLTFAQDTDLSSPQSSRDNLATADLADHRLSPKRIAAELIDYQRHWASLDGSDHRLPTQTEIEDQIPTIAEIVRRVTGHDFMHYKPSTLGRRVRRRLQVLKMPDPHAYVDRLTTDSDEARLLFHELLIGVTSFFRDSETFEQLANIVLPKLFENRDHSETIRVWVAGCSSGEEAYTLAMLCREERDRHSTKPKIQILATDIDERALATARAGSYPLGIEAHVSAARLERFFQKAGNRYTVRRELREMLFFSRHNLIGDAPFSRIDLISCRNLLIYLGSHLQKKLIPLFHYALRPEGYLLLGPSENLRSHGDLFRLLDAKHRISQRKVTAAGSPSRLASLQTDFAGPLRPGTCPDNSVNMTELQQRILLDEFAPKSVVIDESGQVLNATSDMQKYLTIGDGDFQNNIVKMAHPNLRMGLRAAIDDAMKIRRKVQRPHLSIRDGDLIQEVMLTVQPMPKLGEDDSLYMVVFQDVGLPIHRDQLDTPTREDHRRDVDSIISRIERELETTRNDLERTMRETEVANEELKSSNEELLSMNEELQSANEELEASKEELVASNEAMTVAKDDLENLLRSSQIATVFLDEQLRIRNFTPAITELYELIRSDIGRPLAMFVPKTQAMPPLPDPASLNERQPVKHTVLTSSGKSFIRNVLPYQAYSGETRGIVVTFTDVSELQESETRFRATFENAAVGIAHVAPDGSWLRVNHRLCEIVGYEREYLLNKTFQDITYPEDLQNDLDLLQQLVEGKIAHYGIDKRYIKADGGIAWVHLTASMIAKSNGEPDYFIAVVEDITARKHDERIRLESERRLRLAVSVVAMGIIEIDYLQNRAIADPQAAALFDLPANEFIPREDVHSRFHPNDRQRIEELIEASLSPDGTGELNTEHRVLLPDGTVRWLRVSKKILFQDTPTGRRPASGLAAAMDVTERKRSEQRFQEMTNTAPAMLWVSDQNHQRTFLSRGWCEFTGQNHSEGLGMGWTKAIHPEDREQAEKIFLTAAQKRLPFELDYRLQTTTGSYRWAIDAGRPQLDDRGHFEGYIGSVIDVHQRHQAEDALRNSEAHFRLMFQSAPGLYLVLHSDLTIAAASNQYLEATSTERAKIVGRRLFEVFPNMPDDPKADGAENLSCSLETVLKTREPHHMPIQRYPLRRPDGTWEARWWSITNVPILDDAKKVVLIIQRVEDVTDFVTKRLSNGSDTVGQMDDATERLESELFQRAHDIEDANRRLRNTLEKLQASENRLRLAAESTGFGTYDFDCQSLRSVWSSELFRIFGIPESPHVTVDQILERLHPKDADKIKKTFDTAILSDTPERHEMEFRIIRPDGEVRWMIDSGRTFFDGDQHHPVRIVGTIQDITERKIFEQSLQRARRTAEAANRSRGEFLANMSHEIRTPMTAILGHADILKDHLKDPDNIQAVETIRRNGAFLLEIINDILDLSKIDAGKFEIEQERVRPDTLVGDIRSLMDVRAKEKNLPLRIEFDGKIPAMIETDAVRLRQVLLNLLGNAIKFTDEGEIKLVVRYVKHAQQLQFDIVDSGIGIRRDDLENLFKPFTQADNSSTRSFGGTGLGLAISRRLAQALGGDVTVRSEFGKGSVFTLTIKTGKHVDLIEPNLNVAITDEPPNEEIHIEGTILVVDDRRDIRYLAQHFIEKAGGSVVTATNGQEAIEVLQASQNDDQPPIDLIVMDMQMPVMDGYDAATQLRRSGCTLPIIALTANAMKSDRDECLAAGCTDYTTKPLNSHKLVALIARLIGTQHPVDEWPRE